MPRPGEFDIPEQASDITIAECSILEVKKKILARQHYAKDRQEKILAFCSAKKYAEDRKNFILAQQEEEHRKKTVLTLIEERNKQYARWLHDTYFCYVVYGFLDGLSNSYSLIKYCFDILFADSDISTSILMHDWLLTPEGLATAITSAFIIVSSSMIANVPEERTNKYAFLRQVSYIQPYGRDLVKALKNAQKGTRSTIQSISMLSGAELNFLMLPSALILGGLSVLNRLWYRSMKDERIAKQKINAELLSAIKSGALLNEDACKVFRTGYNYCVKPEHLTAEDTVKNTLYFKIQGDALEYTVRSPKGKIETALIEAEKLKELGCKLSSPLTEEQLKPYLPEIIKITSLNKHTYCTTGIQTQTDTIRTIGFVSAAYGGFIDGLYNNMGVMGITALTPPIFIALFACSALLFVVTMINRIYEEYDYQRKFVSSQTKIELELCGEIMRYHIQRLQEISEQLSNPLYPVYLNEEDDDLIESQPLSQEDEEKLSDMPPDLRALCRKQLQITSLLTQNLKKFNEYHAELDSQTTLSYGLAVLAGLRNGLYACSAIGSMMYAVAGASVIFLFPVSPFFLLACMAASVACLVGFLIYSLVNTYLHERDKKPQQASTNKNLGDFLKSVKTAIHESSSSIQDLLQPTKVTEAIDDGKAINGTPQSFYQEGFEDVRTFFAALRQVGKLADTLDIEMQIMGPITIVCSGLLALGSTARAHAKSFGRPPIDAVEPSSDEAISPDTVDQILSSEAGEPSIDEVTLTNRVEQTITEEYYGLHVPEFESEEEFSDDQDDDIPDNVKLIRLRKESISSSALHELNSSSLIESADPLPPFQPLKYSRSMPPHSHRMSQKVGFFSFCMPRSQSEGNVSMLQDKSPGSN